MQNNNILQPNREPSADNDAKPHVSGSGVNDWFEVDWKYVAGCIYFFVLRSIVLKKIMRIEIVPKNDTQDHQQGGICKCWPNLIFESGSIIVVHNAYDGRVSVENAKEILNIKQVPEQWEIFTEQ